MPGADDEDEYDSASLGSMPSRPGGVVIGIEEPKAPLLVLTP
jgi:hypothetical protein